MTKSRIQFIDINNLMQFESKTSFKSNYFFASVIWQIKELGGFEFPNSLQNEDFILQKMNINEATQETSFVDYLTLDNSFKKTGYFEAYKTNTGYAEIGFYRIKVGNYKTSNLFEIKNFELENITTNNFTDNEGNTFVDNEGDTFVETINI